MNDRFQIYSQYGHSQITPITKKKKSKKSFVRFGEFKNTTNKKKTNDFIGNYREVFRIDKTRRKRKIYRIFAALNIKKKVKE